MDLRTSGIDAHHQYGQFLLGNNFIKLFKNHNMTKYDPEEEKRMAQATKFFHKHPHVKKSKATRPIC
jgi:hypothetical protein